MSLLPIILLSTGDDRNFDQRYLAFLKQKKGGPRVCLGMNLAIFQAIKLTVEVFKDFELEFAPGW